MSATARDVAKLMLARFSDGDGYLSQDEAALAIDSEFGEPWIYYNDNGNLAIARGVLAAFRELTPDAVWDRTEKAWRRRDSGDDPKKRQVG